MANDRITVGKIVAPHGVRGDVRVMPLTDFPDRFQKLKDVYLDDEKKVTIESTRAHKQFILVKFRGLDNANDVEVLRGKLIKINREDLVVLPEGHYYFFDIIGMEVYTEVGEFLGKITDILETGSNDVYVAEKEGAKPLLIPALKKVVLTINVPNKQMIVRLQEEWADDAD